MESTYPKRKITKRNKKTIAAVISAALTVLLILTLWLLLSKKPMDGLENTLGGNKKTAVTSGFRLCFIDVGQGDCTLLICDGKTMLIDAGEAGQEIVVENYLKSCGITKLDYAVATHPHSDHIGSMDDIVEAFSPENFVMPYLPNEMIPDTYVYSNMMTAVEKSGSNIITPIAGDTFSVGSAQVVVLGPTDDYSDDLNDMSLVLMIYYGDTSYLLTGDMETLEEQDILDSPAVLDCDVLKVAHHGSSTSSSEEFLAGVKPEYCIISVGSDNAYGHPHDVTISRLKKYTDKIYRTDINGDIVVKSDGTTISVIVS